MSASPRLALFASLAAISLGACSGGDPVGGGGGSGGKGGAGPADPPPVSTRPGDGGATPFVDPFIGTGYADVTSSPGNGKGGNTFPGAALPFGMVQWSPDTPSGVGGYRFGDGVLTGFGLTHVSGAGCAAKHDFPVFPIVGAWDPAMEPRDTFTHDAEIASPGFYEVTLASGIKVDLTATTRTGFARFTFPSAKDAKILISGGWLADSLTAADFGATLRDDGTITGHRTDAFFCGTSPSYRVHFAARFDRPFAEKGTWSGGSAESGTTTVSGTRAGVYVGFDASEQHVVHMEVGISYVSEENAIANLDAESQGWDFDAVHAAAIARWDEMLGRVRVEGGTDDERRAFYTALYHVFLQPGAASDVNGDYVGFDGQIKNAGERVRYADFSGWDIYRSWIQLASVIAPAETSDMMRSLVDAGAECGALPKWALESTETSVMVGDPADAILADAYAFGARDFDAQKALELMVKGATDPAAQCNGKRARKGLADYLALHYCPVDGKDAPDGPPATTMEYAVADFAIARLAAALGDAATESAFMERGRYWQNIWNPTLQGNGFTGYPAPRYAQDQNGAPAFQQLDPGKYQGFVEGNATQYLFMVPHDVPGLIAAVGGDQMMIDRLDAHHTKLNAGLDEPYLYIGNEPGFGTPWEYPFAGAPWRTQDVVRRIVTEVFATTPGGLPGNDDLGATSSWQVWAMLGLYPAIPGVGGFVLGSPIFPKVTITLAGDKTLIINGNGASAKAPYVQSLMVNGKPSTSTWIAWDDVAAGATLDFTLGEMPNPTWGIGAGDRPPAFYP